MKFTSTISYLVAGLSFTINVLAAPAPDAFPVPAALEKRTVYSGYCNVDQNACNWSAPDGSRVGTCTCSTGNECRIPNGRCYYDDQTLSCICPNGT